MNHRSRFLVILPLAVFYLGETSFAQMSGGGMGMGSGTFMGYDGHDMDHDLILPQVVVGQHYTTSLLLLSMGNPQVMNWVPTQNLTTTGKVVFYRQDGTRLPVSVNGGTTASEFSFSLNPTQSVGYELSSTGPDTPGWALIDIDEPVTGSGWGMMDGQTMTRGMRVMASVFYTYSGEDEPTSRVGVVPSMYEMGKFDTAMISVQARENLYTGMAIVNVNAKPVTVTMRLKDSNGTVLASSPMTLNPGGQIAKFINQLFSTVLPANFQGFLEVDSVDEGIVTMGLLVSQGILTSVPMTHYGHITMMP